ncbi:hypothetical protein BJ138DRAFT_691328 [Hygrophoropsis aurantiaca]|uniref:Uncharacterized protein n=1 Tax=Hygrophoropsis aurantiaca TaxID=72124 RepID=A0ACB8ASN8_9AGAM|nr:hypothetical protein BJ138DRAFT_691328 [Hygrophoropsis aurantiaca]
MSDPPPSPADIQTLALMSVSALAFCCWDLFLTFDDEVRLIWSKSSKSSIKWMFLSARYIGIGSLASFVSLGTIGPMLGCQGVIVLQVTMSQILVMVLETVLYLRVHALYNQNRHMRLFLIFLAFSGTTTALLSLILSMPYNQFDANCVITRTGPGAPALALQFCAYHSRQHTPSARSCEIHTYLSTVWHQIANRDFDASRWDNFLYLSHGSIATNCHTDGACAWSQHRDSDPIF